MRYAIAIFETLPTPLLKLALLLSWGGVAYLVWQARKLWRWVHASYTALGWQEPAQPYSPLTRGDTALAEALAYQVGKEGKRNAQARRKATA